MKTPGRKAATKKNGKTPRLRRKSLKDSELPSEAREFRRKFREWDESLQSRAKRMAYIRKLCR